MLPRHKLIIRPQEQEDWLELNLQMFIAEFTIGDDTCKNYEEKLSQVVKDLDTALNADDYQVSVSNDFPKFITGANEGEIRFSSRIDLTGLIDKGVYERIKMVAKHHRIPVQENLGETTDWSEVKERWHNWQF